MNASIHNWIKNHDERWSFILFYVGGALFLSVYTNLFWVVMLMLGHLGIEVWRHMVIKVEKPILMALWQVKLDIALVLFALVIALYAHLAMAALGIGQAARAGQAVRGAQILTRIAIIERGLRIFFLTIDDMARIAHIVWKLFQKKNGIAAKKEMVAAREVLKEEEREIHGKWGLQRLSKGDIFSLVFGALCLSLLLAAPWVTGFGVSGVLDIISRELHP